MQEMDNIFPINAKPRAVFHGTPISYLCCLHFGNMVKRRADPENEETTSVAKRIRKTTDDAAVEGRNDSTLESEAVCPNLQISKSLSSKAKGKLPCYIFDDYEDEDEDAEENRDNIIV